MAEAATAASHQHVDDFQHGRTQRSLLEKLGWVALVALLGVGVSSVVGRMLFMIEAQGVADPSAAFNPFDARYAEMPITSWLHLLPALIIAFTGPFQFIRRIRKRWPVWHRWSGRVYLFTGLVAAVSGFIIGGLNPFMGLNGPGFNEAMATTAITLLVVIFLVQAYRTARTRQFAAHREWVIRSWTVMLGIATERLLLVTFRAVTDVELSVLFGTTFWMALVINLGAAEYWIRLTRTRGSGLRHWKDLDGR